MSEENKEKMRRAVKEAFGQGKGGGTTFLPPPHQEGWEDEKGSIVSGAYGSAALALRERGAGPAADPDTEHPGSLHRGLRRGREGSRCGGQRARPGERPSGEVRLHQCH